jgi:hypothetical protein
MPRHYTALVANIRGKVETVTVEMTIRTKDVTKIDHDMLAYDAKEAFADAFPLDTGDNLEIRNVRKNESDGVYRNHGDGTYTLAFDIDYVLTKSLF